MSDQPDLLVIGGGAAGLAAARTAARSKRRVTLVQDGPVGGDCTFTGCVPSKTLLESGGDGLDFAAALARVRETVERIAATETADVLRGEGIEVLDGRARFETATAVQVEGRTVRAPRAVIATGSAPARPPLPGVEHPDVLTTDTVWTLRDPPASVVLLGAGPVGCELAQALARLGTRVTVLEQASRILPHDDRQASAVLAARFADQGIAVRTGTAVRRIVVTHTDRRAVRVDLDDDHVEAERLLLATGRSPRSEDLAEVGLSLDEAGFVRVDDAMATGLRGVWTAGDVTGRMLFTHAADEMGRIAAVNALRRPLRLRLHAASVPRVTFTDPEVAQVGVTEVQAARTGDAVVAELPMGAVDRAVAAGRTEGFVKLIARPRTRSRALGRLIGATVVAPRAGEMIHELALAVRTGMPVVRLAQTVHAYPTWSTAVRSAAAQFLFEVDGRRARPAMGP